MDGGKGNGLQHSMESAPESRQTDLGMVVPMNCEDVGSKMGSAAFRMRLNREADWSVPVEMFCTWL